MEDEEEENKNEQLEEESERFRSVESGEESEFELNKKGKRT